MEGLLPDIGSGVVNTDDTLDPRFQDALKGAEALYAVMLEIDRRGA